MALAIDHRPRHFLLRGEGGIDLQNGPVGVVGHFDRRRALAGHPNLPCRRRVDVAEVVDHLFAAEEGQKN